MMLSHVTIKRYVEEGKIKVLPELTPKSLHPLGIRLHLGSDILVPRPNQVVDLGNIQNIDYEPVQIGSEGYVLKPNAFILGTTIEQYQFPPDLVGFLDGRSTFARMGLTVHSTSQIIDGNYDYPGSTVLEIKNLGSFDLILKNGLHIAILSFLRLSEPLTDTANFKYRNQTTIRGPERDV